RQQREPHVVGLEYRAAEAAAIDVADPELVVRATHDELQFTPVPGTSRSPTGSVARKSGTWYRSTLMNRLAQETSPYLLQHAGNPVDWYPWGDEAFARAREDDKPILLSVGYSACHWCHVMERESFEDVATAELMNEHFVNIKVDREERPDVDSVYMDAVVSLSGHGGWPMTVFLTSEGEPFY